MARRKEITPLFPLHMKFWESSHAYYQVTTQLATCVETLLKLDQIKSGGEDLREILREYNRIAYGRTDDAT